MEGVKMLYIWDKIWMIVEEWEEAHMLLVHLRHVVNLFMPLMSFVG